MHRAFRHWPNKPGHSPIHLPPQSRLNRPLKLGSRDRLRSVASASAWKFSGPGGCRIIDGGHRASDPMSVPLSPTSISVRNSEVSCHLLSSILVRSTSADRAPCRHRHHRPGAEMRSPSVQATSREDVGLTNSAASKPSPRQLTTISSLPVLVLCGPYA